MDDVGYFRLNSLEVVSKDRFYYTNMLWRHGILGTIQIYMDFHWGSVGYYDGSRGHIVFSSRRGPNGIASSPDGK